MEQTSLEAYAWIKEHSTSLRAQLYGAIYARGSYGATCDELEQIHSMKHQTASARIRELRDAKLIYDSNERRTTRSGRKAIVYVAARLVRRMKK